jgi:S-adenosylmethionine:tRNA ribosyltransferase-isomerase
MYSLDHYDYSLPEGLIAQTPVPSRDQSRLMVLNRKRQSVSHYHFANIAELLSSGDLLVVNNTKVIPARLTGSKETGGKVEVLLLGYPRQTQHSQDSGRLIGECLVKASKRPRIGSKLYFNKDLHADVVGGTNGLYELEFSFKGDFESLLNKIGEMPLPPYIRRDKTGPSPCNDRVSYQTVYAEKSGAVAAPTAGLHFSNELLRKLSEKGVEVVPITLHVGYGTFLPIRVLDIREHRIHSEAFELTGTAAAAINKARDEGRRIIAVGTTTVRVLEFTSDSEGRVKAGAGECDLFIYPGFEYRVIDALMTNFHLPRTTLLMLVAAFAGRNFVLNAYQEAIRRQYRFYSYGDAMLIL